MLYEKYDARFFGVCKRYFSNIHQAEDALVKGFLRVFQNLESYRFQGSFEGWMHRIFVNECLMELRKNKAIMVDYDQSIEAKTLIATENTSLEEQDIMQTLFLLPEGCRLVFTLFVLEGYKHKEIAQILEISEGTSKSQLNLAKTKLKELLSKQTK
ncbi:Sigma-24 [Weeksella virosa]|nr:Sigma-24 [Weeksella virosa]VEH64631.1 Sigma-24 [Weeksella virosa]